MPNIINFIKYATIATTTTIAPAKATPFDWRGEANRLINFYEGDNNNLLYKDNDGSLTFPGGLHATPEYQSLARKFGYRGAFKEKAALDKNIRQRLMSAYTDKMYRKLESMPGFAKLDPRVKARLADAQYNGNVVGNWTNLTKAVAAGNYSDIAKELKDSKVYRNELAKSLKNPNARTRFGDHVNYINSLKLKPLTEVKQER